MIASACALPPPNAVASASASGRFDSLPAAAHYPFAFLAALAEGDIDLETGEHALAVQEFVEAVLQPDLIGMDLSRWLRPGDAKAA